MQSLYIVMERKGLKRLYVGILGLVCDYLPPAYTATIAIIVGKPISEVIRYRRVQLTHIEKVQLFEAVCRDGQVIDLEYLKSRDWPVIGDPLMAAVKANNLRTAEFLTKWYYAPRMEHALQSIENGYLPMVLLLNCAVDFVSHLLLNNDHDKILDVLLQRGQLGNRDASDLFTNILRSCVCVLADIDNIKQLVGSGGLSNLTNPVHTTNTTNPTHTIDPTYKYHYRMIRYGQCFKRHYEKSVDCAKCINDEYAAFINKAKHEVWAGGIYNTKHMSRRLPIKYLIECLNHRSDKQWVTKTLCNDPDFSQIFDIKLIKTKYTVSEIALRSFDFDTYFSYKQILKSTMQIIKLPDGMLGMINDIEKQLNL